MSPDPSKNIFFAYMDNQQYILTLVKNKIRIIDPKAKIFLFGSRARNDFKKDSDWDFLILTEKEVNRELKNKISDSLFEAELDTEQIITSIVQNTKNWNKYSKIPIFMNIVKDGIEI
jgi:predicted nucleotidyltransferase